MTFAPQVRIPTLVYDLQTPSTKTEKGGRMVPGFDEESIRTVAFESFKYTDVWAGLDSVEMVFSDPVRTLVDNPKLKEFQTKLRFRFGYRDTKLSQSRTMTLYRVKQSYPSSGKVQTTLIFFSAGVEIGSQRRNFLYKHTTSEKRGQRLLASEVATLIARDNGFIPQIEPTLGNDSSARIEWKQHNQTDIEFLNEMGEGLRAANTRNGEGRYYVQVRDNALIFGPINVNAVPIVFVYKGVNSPLRSFSPTLPADMMRGMGWLSGFAGVDPNVGGADPRTGNVSGVVGLGGVCPPPVTPQGLRTQDNDIVGSLMDTSVVGSKRGQSQHYREEDAGATHPARFYPEIERRRTDLQTQIELLEAGIKVKRDGFLGTGLPPNEVRDLLKADQSNLDDTRALLARINGVTPDRMSESELCTFLLEPSPFEEQNRQFGDDTFRTSQMNMLTASAELWGFPLLKAGDPWGVIGVAERFAGKWWIKEVVHKIDNSTGFTTNLDMQKNALGIGDPAAGNAADGSDALLKVVFIYNFQTGVGKWVIHQTQAALDLEERQQTNQRAVRVVRSKSTDELLTDFGAGRDIGLVPVQGSGQHQKP